MTERDPEVSLNACEVIASGGVRRVTWHVQRGDDWIVASQLENAEISQDPSRPGVVWQQRTRVRLPHGTRLMRVESLPDRERARDPIDYLWDARPRAARRIVRHFFRVDASGALMRER